MNKKQRSNDKWMSNSHSQIIIRKTARKSVGIKIRK